MEILITEADYNKAIGTAEVRSLRDGQKEAILGDKPEPANQAILDALPRVLADRFKNMIPPDYEVQQIELKVQIAGQPFGIGIRGDAVVKFGPRAVKS